MPGRFPTGALQPDVRQQTAWNGGKLPCRFFPAFSGVFFAVFLRPLSLGNQSGALL
jgi:hypothetical protein